MLRMLAAFAHDNVVAISVFRVRSHGLHLYYQMFTCQLSGGDTTGLRVNFYSPNASRVNKLLKPSLGDIPSNNTR